MRGNGGKMVRNVFKNIFIYYPHEQIIATAWLIPSGNQQAINNPIGTIKHDDCCCNCKNQIELRQLINFNHKQFKQKTK